MGNQSETPKYWFKRRRFGWGWTPVTWQGWVCIAVSIAILIVAVIIAGTALTSTLAVQLIVSFVIIADICGMLLVCHAKGPNPKWRFGKRDDDNPDEDL